MVSISMIVGVGATAHAAPPVPVAKRTVLQGPQSVLDAQGQTAQLLELIAAIPDSVLLQGDAAKNAWITERLVASGLSPVAVAELDGTGAVPDGFLECSGAILILIGTTAIPAAKLLRIKRLMDDLGGVTTAIRIMWGASFSHEKLKAVGAAAAALGAELLGIAAVKTACF
ncbi:hypothetical protein AB6N23_07460 [Cellulomonas sp. 179-A 9B4 NHS]|uniref:hypothetical protein n=1 Tax=Cellulomonas sp. 179-A 9B4 NHS TaxID=3142379 RepID=UPI0039A29A51